MRLVFMVLAIVVFLFALAVLPLWPVGVGWRLFPSGLLLSLFCIVMLIWLFGIRRAPPI
jgi:hypothetical protein